MWLLAGSRWGEDAELVINEPDEDLAEVEQPQQRSLFKRLFG